MAEIWVTNWQPCLFLRFALSCFQGTRFNRKNNRIIQYHKVFYIKFHREIYSNCHMKNGQKFVPLPNNVKTEISNMLFTEKIKELRIQNQMPQRQIAAALDIDTATYCKIEKGERRAKKEQVAILSEMFHVEMTYLLTLWLADKVTDMVSDEHVIASEALSIAAKNLRRIG